MAPSFLSFIDPSEIERAMSFSYMLLANTLLCYLAVQMNRTPVSVVYTCTVNPAARLTSVEVLLTLHTI